MSKSAGFRRTPIEPVMGASPLVSARLSLVVVLLLVVSIADNQLTGSGSSHNLVEARYLPTRSDDSSVDALKEIIKNVLDEAAEQREAAASGSRPFVRAARFFSTQSRAGQQRQRYLTGKSNNNESEQVDEMPSAWLSSRSPAFLQRRLAELILAGEPIASRSMAANGSNRYFRQQEANQRADG